MTPTGAVCALHPGSAAVAACRRCGTFVCAQCASGTDLRCPSCRALSAERVPPPWERRGELGLLAALWQQFKLTTFGPDPFWRTVPAEGPVLDPFLFAWFTAVAQVPGNFVLNLINFYSLEGSFRFAPGVWAWFSGLGPLKYALLASAAPVVLFPVIFYLSAALTHAGCLLWGAGSKGFHATLRVMGYAQAPLLAGFVPIVGVPLAIYVVVQQIFGVTHVHGASGLRATAGVLTGPIALFCCFVPLAFVAAIGVATAALR